jgi:hypothetical protein
MTMNTHSIFLNGTLGISIDFDSVETRLSLLELSSYARTNANGSAKFVDSTGTEFVLDAAEIRELVATAHRMMHGGTTA